MKAAIISLNFHPGHISHAIASYKQCKELGYETCLYMNPQFKSYIKDDLRFIGSDNPCPEIDLAIFMFPSQKNLGLIFNLKRKHTRIVYIFHEPIESFKEYKESGYTSTKLILERIKHWVSAFTVRLVDVVLLPSNKAVRYYGSNKIYKNRNYHYFPLMYDDEREKRQTMMPRLYFGYIGTVASDHSFDEYLKFVEWAITNNRLEGISFLVGTKSEFEVPEALAKSSRVTIKKGTPMTDEEINAYYASTIVVWNAYARTTQSGVLAKSFMFGTPALVMRKNLNEFTHDCENVVAIDDNTNFGEIEAAVKKIHENFEAFSAASRKEFEKSFYYRVYNERFREIVNGKSQGE